jgi:hypothetical protein
MASQHAQRFTAAGAPFSAMKELRGCYVSWKECPPTPSPVECSSNDGGRIPAPGSSSTTGRWGNAGCISPGYSMNAMTPYNPVGVGAAGLGRLPTPTAPWLQDAIPSNAMSADMGYGIGVSAAGNESLKKRRKSTKLLEQDHEEDDNEAREIAVAAFKESLKNFPGGLPARSPRHQQGYRWFL